MVNNEKKMMIISAHAADWCTRAGGTIIKMIDEGWDAAVYALTYGEHGESGAYWKNHKQGTYEECKALRRKEVQDAARIMGISSIEFLDYGDYPLVLDEQRIRGITSRILEYRPSLILTHWIHDPVNLDHQVAGRAVISAVNAAGMRGAAPGTEPHMIPDLFFFETTVPQSEFNGFKADTFIDIDQVFSRKTEAVSCFEQQPQLSEYYEKTAEHRGRQASDWARNRRTVRYAEGFVRYTPYVGTALPLMNL